MVDDNVLRKESVKDLEGIHIYTKNSSTYYRGSDLADYQIEIIDGISRLIVLTIEGKLHKFYNIPFEIVYKNQEEI